MHISFTPCYESLRYKYCIYASLEKIETQREVICPAPRVSDCVCLGCHLRICISNQCPSDAARPGNTIWEPLSFRASVLVQVFPRSPGLACTTIQPVSFITPFEVQKREVAFTQKHRRGWLHFHASAYSLQELMDPDIWRFQKYFLLKDSWQFFSLIF